MDTPAPFPEEAKYALEQQGSDYHTHLQARLIELAYDAIIVRDATSTIISWNRGAEQLYGWSAQEAIGQFTHTLLQTRFPQSREILDRFLDTGERWDGELMHTRKDGIQVLVESRQILLRDAHNQQTAILEINRDITERRQREQDNQAQYRQLAALVESAAVPIMGKTREGIITSWNRAAEQLYGYHSQEAIGQPITLIFPPDRQEEFTRIMEQIVQGERVDLYETVRRRKDGALLPVSVTVSPIYANDGQISGASSIAHDITERKRSEEQEHFLTEVSRVLSSTLDYQETLTNIAHLAVPRLADWFVVDLVDAQGHFQRLELMHTNPEHARRAQLIRARHPLDVETAPGPAHVIHTGQAALYPEITDAMLVATTRNEEELAMARQIGYSSLMIVPLVARGKTLGVVSFVAAESGKHYDKRDLALAEEIGRRIGVALDHARLYREAQQARDQLAIILQEVADGIFVYAPDSRLLYGNETAARMSGYDSVQEMLATAPLALTRKYDLINEQGQPLPLSQLTHLRVLAGELEAQSIVGFRESGSKHPDRWSLVTSRPIHDTDGAVAMVVTITHDITERLLTDRRKDEFMSMASHELKTPVTSLKGFTNVLQRRLIKQADTQGLHYLSRIDAQLDKLTALINDLLDISRMQSGKLTLHEEVCDLDALIAETVENVQVATTTHQLLIEGQTSAQVFGDRDRLEQVFVNLLTNAIKYSPQANQVIVRLCRADNQEQAVVSVEDSGMGIDPAHHEQIFERFYQVTDPEEKTYPGLGIGLYISHEIIVRHQGRMWVKSSKGHGATFFVALPLQPSGEAAAMP